MKKITLLLLTIFLFSCKGKGIQETEFTYTLSPNETYSYAFVLKSKILTITQEVDFKLVKATNDTLQLEAEIKDMKWKDDGGELEQETNQYYKDRFINRPFVFSIDTQGKVLQNLEYKSGRQGETVFDINNFFMELPAGIQKTGDSWTRLRPAVDLMFTKIDSKYTLLEIENDSLAHIKVHSELKSDDENSSFTKNLKGRYIINTKNGLLEAGELEMGGFNGFSNISGTIRIYKK
ncbi:hypothetical protein [uncultured Kordia sp.]|uniref:hypothetical protein n=1 Tax=uncultured Kordia sp. TaxID=507699 RepID=UPI0026082B7C|nr:hypothetical protein [uncultured Kordia sp.]